MDDLAVGGLLIRPAAPEDTPDVQSLCAQLNPQDYAIPAWPRWIATASGTNLLASIGGQVVGCVHAEGITAREGWIQALRVHPIAQRRGIGFQLLAAAPRALTSQGIHRVRASVDSANWPSRRLLRRAGWQVVGHVRRRRAVGRAENVQPVHPASAGEVWRLVATSAMLASRRHVARFGRVYFSWTPEYLNDLAGQHAVIVSSDGRALATLDPTAPAAMGARWIVGIVGNPGSMVELLERIHTGASDRGQSVIVDSPARVAIQRAMDRMGFEPPDHNGDFLIVQRS